VEGGDGADTLLGSVDGGDETLAGGAGNDGLNGRGGADVVDGGPGDDGVRGGAGRDAVLGGEGTDTLGGDDLAAVDADVLDGGPGVDSVGYGSRRSPLTIDLRRTAGQGERGEGDELRDVEGATLGVAADVFPGTDARTVVNAGTGDVVRTSGGDDHVQYGAYGAGPRSAGLVDLGDGDDRYRGSSRSGTPRIVCGAGRDALDRPQSLTRIPADCERLELGASHDVDHPGLTLRGGVVSGPRLACGPLRRTPRERCTARLRLQLGAAPGGARLGSSPFVADAVGGGSAAMRVRLGSYGRRLLAARGRLPVRVTVERRTGGRRVYALDSWSATLRR
jgi:hypothetical protein